MASYGKLKALRVSYLKIDGTFVRDLANNPLDRAMVQSINQLAHVLGIETVAEGVSGAPLMDRLRVLGVDYAQGFGVDSPRAARRPARTGRRRRRSTTSRRALLTTHGPATGGAPPGRGARAGLPPRPYGNGSLPPYRMRASSSWATSAESGR